MYVRRLASYSQERKLLLTYYKRAVEKLRCLKVCARNEIDDLKTAMQQMKTELDTCKILLQSSETEIKKLLKERTTLQQQRNHQQLPDNNSPEEETIKKLKLDLIKYKEATDVALPMLKELRESLNRKQVKEDVLIRECGKLQARIDELESNAINRSCDDRNNNNLDLSNDNEALSTDGAI